LGSCLDSNPAIKNTARDIIKNIPNV